MTRHSTTPQDVEGALQHAHDRLSAELDERYPYHGLYHTFEDVLPAALYLAEVYDLPPAERGLLRVAVAYHDIGFIEGHLNHEQRGIEVVSQTLPRFYFGPEEVSVVSDLIRATHLPQTPRNLLEEIIADADLDVLGRDDFPVRNALLYRETLLNGSALSEGEWLQYQVRFLSDHRYFTQAARERRDQGKARNLAALLEKTF